MSSPPARHIPAELHSAYTLGGRIPVHDWYFDNRTSDSIMWTDEYVEKFIAKYTLSNIIENKIMSAPPEEEPYSNGSLYNVTAICKYIDNVRGKDVAVIGSLTPWLEAIIINMGAKSVTTVEYNKPTATTKIKTIEYTDFVRDDQMFDAIFSYSSIEHSGLGRYGDPLNPDGDIEAMQHIHAKLRDGGLLFLGVPVGKDAITWNAHRVYGEIRLPLITRGFVELEWIGVDKHYIRTCGPCSNGPQPVMVYRKA